MGVDATLVSPLHADGLPWSGAADTDGVSLARAKASKARVYPELADASSLRLVVAACEVGGRWSEDALALLRQLSGARAREAPALLRAQVRAAWQTRWLRLLSVAQQTALAATLAEDAFPTLGGVDAEPPCDVAVWLDAEV